MAFGAGSYFDGINVGGATAHEFTAAQLGEIATVADHLTRALETRQVRALCLGIGVDPLTFATDILTIVTIDAPIYDELFGQVADTNAEGSILPAVVFTAETIERYVNNEPTQAAGAGLLRLAWGHRSILLD